MSESKAFTIHPPRFECEKNTLSLSCSYSCGELSFTENFTFTFPTDATGHESELHKACEIVAIAAAPSYYKATCAENIFIDFDISEETKIWATGLFDQGLREFRFRNNFDLADTPTVTTTSKGSVPLAKGAYPLEVKRALVPIGGGKDSITTLHILKNAGVELVGFSVGDFEQINKTAVAAGIDLVRASRTIDPRLFELNEQGAPNGHVPVTALTSALAVIAALCIRADSVVMSNEKSADEPTRVVQDVEVNHQWSKTFEAEELFRAALASSGVSTQYFSLLRPLTEYQIFSVFARLDDYHHVFTSCNRVFTIDKDKRASSWCGDCDKCRFVFLALCAFRDVDYVANIFHKNLFDDASQTQGFLDLLGLDTKPFECVGTIKETRIFARKALEQKSICDSVVGVDLEPTVRSLNVLEEKMYGDGHAENIPENILKTTHDIFIDQYRCFVRDSIGDSTVAVMGLGRDTAAMIRYLDACGITADIAVYLPQNADDDFDEILSNNGLSNISLTLVPAKSIEDIATKDIVYVSPGISRYSDEVVSLGTKATTPVCAWFEINREFFPGTTFIGVTGTKGKSTTSSMLAHVLPHSLVAGNLGVAVGDIAFDDIFAAQFIVLEISSFQASYFTTSPDVVAVTSLFDCHIDWHRTPENYRKDKLNLALHSPSEIVTSDTIKDFAPLLSSIRKENNLVDGVDVITLVASAGKSLLQRNQDLVREVVALALPDLQGQALQEKLLSFQELKYRQEIVTEKNGVTYVSDVLSTAPQAALMAADDFALRYPDANIYLLCGGAYRDVDLGELADGLNARKDRVKTIALPETGHMIEDKLENYVHCDELADGVAYAASVARPDDIVLLAPGAPSFHRYKDYTKLAEHFEELVAAL